MTFQALDAHKSPHLLARLLDTPNLPQVVRALLILRSCTGLSACSAWRIAENSCRWPRRNN